LLPHAVSQSESGGGTGLPAYEKRLAERIVPEEDVQRMLAVEMEPRDRVLLRLLYSAGLRVSEACGLRWRNLSARGDAGQITVYGKNGRTRAIALPKEVWEDLNKLRESAGFDSPVFASKSGQALDRGRVRVILRKAAENAGVSDKTPQISPHWLRHAHASHAVDHGAPIHLVQATLGHSSVATTSSYLHARPGDSSARFLQTRA
jgi:site-specific recombinase XerD